MRLPARLQDLAVRGLIRLSVGPPERYGLPAPGDGDLNAQKPVVNTQLLHWLHHGRIDVAPGLAALEGGRVRFVDGRARPFDTILWATGFEVSLPFLDPALLRCEDSVPLRVAGATLPAGGPARVYLLGLTAPRGGQLPVYSAQAALVVRMLAHQEGRREALAVAFAGREQPDRAIDVVRSRWQQSLDRAHAILDELEGRPRRRAAAAPPVASCCAERRDEPLPRRPSPSSARSSPPPATPRRTTPAPACSRCGRARGGAEVELLPSLDGLDLVARTRGRGRGRVVLLGHHDTVFGPGSAVQRPVHVVGGPRARARRGGHQGRPARRARGGRAVRGGVAKCPHEVVELHSVPTRRAATSSRTRSSSCAAPTPACASSAAARPAHRDARKAGTWLHADRVAGPARRTEPSRGGTAHGARREALRIQRQATAHAPA